MQRIINLIKENQEYILKIYIIFILLLLFLLLINNDYKKENIEIKPKIEKTTIAQEIKKEEPKIIIVINTVVEEFIDYKYKPLMLKKTLNNLKFNDSLFDVTFEKSNIDANLNNIDDYTDLYIGALKYTDTKPIYFSNYYEGGYPPEEEGVCTDVIWNAFFNAGYDLKTLIDEDIYLHKKAYKNIKVQDKNIDFRRVSNLIPFFKRHSTILTIDTSDIDNWQAGDIVVYEFDDGTKHIGILSKYRNYKGQPFVIHHGGRTPAGEANILESKYLTYHFRWNMDI